MTDNNNIEQDAREGDDANFNTEEQEQALNQIDSDEADTQQAIDDTDGASLSTQGDDREKDENLGGTTNLSLDQLKEEGDTAADNS